MRPRQPSRSNQTYRPTSKLRSHPQAALVPGMGEPEYAAFRAHKSLRPEKRNCTSGLIASRVDRSRLP
jgi:hypothetical protein